jgi:hypothetical protein
MCPGKGLCCTRPEFDRVLFPCSIEKRIKHLEEAKGDFSVPSEFIFEVNGGAKTSAGKSEYPDSMMLRISKDEALRLISDLASQFHNDVTEGAIFVLGKVSGRKVSRSC